NCSAKCNYDVDSQSDKLSRNFRVSLHAVFRPAMLDCDGAALDPAELAKPFQKRGVPRTLRPTRSRAEKPDRRQLLLRARREGPRCCRAAECDQQFPSSEGDCHTPLPCEVRKRNDTTLRACSLHVQGGQECWLLPPRRQIPGGPSKEPI